MRRVVGASYARHGAAFRVARHTGIAVNHAEDRVRQHRTSRRVDFNAKCCARRWLLHLLAAPGQRTVFTVRLAPIGGRVRGADVLRPQISIADQVPLTDDTEVFVRQFEQQGGEVGAAAVVACAPGCRKLSTDRPPREECRRRMPVSSGWGRLWAGSGHTR